MIVDNFLDSFDTLERHARSVEYSGVTNPVDGVLYPDVTIDIPDAVKDEVKANLDRIFGPVKINMMFLRLTAQSTGGAPHQAHNDAAMGSHTLLLYLGEGGGTSFVKHKQTGMDGQPETDDEYQAWLADTNQPDAWEVTGMVDAAKNRANIIEAEKMHRAEPIGGFGQGREDGRIVLTAFFEPEVEIKEATFDDVVKLVVYGERFWQQTQYFKDGIAYDPDTILAMTNTLIDEGVVLYADDAEGNVVALMLVIVSPFPMNAHYLAACEWVFYVDPDYRRGGLGAKLIQAAEDLLKEREVKYFTMVSLTTVTPEAAHQVYKSLGFNHSETNFTKDISWQQ